MIVSSETENCAAMLASESNSPTGYRIISQFWRVIFVLVDCARCVEGVGTGGACGGSCDDAGGPDNTNCHVLKKSAIKTRLSAAVRIVNKVFALMDWLLTTRAAMERGTGCALHRFFITVGSRFVTSLISRA